MLDIAGSLHLPVMLVVGMRLGCLNHALLSAAAIRSRGLRFAGWVANCIDPQMDAVEANVESLAARLPAPLHRDHPLGRVAGPFTSGHPASLALMTFPGRASGRGAGSVLTF